MKRDYPLFLIDRTKSEAYPFDYVTCFDKTVGFVARVVFYPEDIQYNEFVKQQANVENRTLFNVMMKFKSGGVILMCEDFLYDFELTDENKNRIKTLLKKALKKYLHAEADRTPFGDLDIENQIKQQQLTIERSKSQYNSLVARSSVKEADYTIALAEATLETLKSFRDNQRYFTAYLN